MNTISFISKLNFFGSIQWKATEKIDNVCQKRVLIESGKKRMSKRKDGIEMT